MKFEQLVAYLRDTHEQMRSIAERSVDVALVARNWMFGWYIVEFEQKGTDRAAYGTALLDRLSSELGKGFSVRTLRQFRQFYSQRKEILQTVSAESPLPIRQTLSAEFTARFPLGWSHYVELLTLTDPAERSFYEIEADTNHWSVRELQRQIASSLYQRLVLSRDKDEIRRLALEGQVVEKAADLIKNPLILEFLGLADRPHYSEDELESAIIDHLQTFLLELGKGFLFEARQKRFTFDNDHYRVDLVFYNRLLRCYVLIDLKRDKLTHQDLGQMQMYPVRYNNESISVRLCITEQSRQAVLRGLHKQSREKACRAPGRKSVIYQKAPSRGSSLLRSMPRPSRRISKRKVFKDRLGKTLHKVSYGQLSHGVYVNYYDRYVKQPDELPTVGIVLCHRKNDALVELTLPADSNIFASKYQLYLPSKEELKAEVELLTRELSREVEP